MGLRAVLCSLVLFVSLSTTKALNFSATQTKRNFVAQTKQKTKQKLARITFYHRHEDKYGNKIACSNTRRARRGRTIAAERSFPFGTVVQIPWLARILGSSQYIVEDRGSAIQSRRASRGQTPVFDIYTETKKEMNYLAAITPPYLPYEIQ